jgi:hypothetical protein
MTSKAWYKPSSTLPQLVARFQQHPQKSSTRSIEIWTTTCIVTNFGMQRHRNDPHPKHSHLPRCSTLINPANPFLTGPHSFPYFPKGGPQPKDTPNRTAHHIMGYVSQWGGMDVGSGEPHSLRISSQMCYGMIILGCISSNVTLITIIRHAISGRSH